MFIAVNDADAEKYLQAFFQKLSSEIREKFAITSACKDYTKMIMAFIEQFQEEEVCIDMVGFSKGALMDEKINSAISSYPNKLPLVFTRSLNVPI